MPRYIFKWYAWFKRTLLSEYIVSSKEILYILEMVEVTVWRGSPV